MKILFLDIDGVINGHEKLPNGYSQMRLDCVDQLARILIAVPDCKIIISSSWRYAFNTPNVFANILCLFGMPWELSQRVIDVTETDEHVCLELGLAESDSYDILDYKWLKENGELVRREQILRQMEQFIGNVQFVVLDDLNLQMPELVQTDGNIGLTIELADEVIRKFGV